MQINEIELHHLRGIVAVAEELNFGRAAERLHLSQPPLTRLVAEVEKALGARLFERTTRRVALTPVGEVFVAEASAVLERMDGALEAAAAAIARQEGLLRLAYVPLALQTVLPGLLASFRERDHDARIDLIEMPGPAQRAALLTGRIDLAFCDEPPDKSELEKGKLESVRLHQEALSLLVPEPHPLAARASVTFSDLAGETLILHPRQEYPEYYDRVQSACRETEAPPKIWERPAGQNCMALVMSGAGLLLSPSAYECVRTPGFRRITVQSPLLRAEVWGIWLQSASSSHVRRLIEIAEAYSARAGS